MINLSNKGALLIGGKRMGRIIANRLAKEKINIALIYHTSKTIADETLKEISPLSKKSCVIKADISNETQVKNMFSVAQKKLQNISFVINLASTFHRTPYNQLNGQDWDTSMNFAKGNYLVCLEGSKYMMKNNSKTKGHIITFGDWAATNTPYRNYLPYLTAKASIDFMTRIFATELSEYNILVNSIAPGPTIQPPEYNQKKWNEKVIKSTPLMKESSVDEISEFIITLLKSETITGETIRIDSGSHLRYR
jgi:NAD(P)-dependent dehydrogenase (short-subunit alcohol dehydrogenase family)